MLRLGVDVGGTFTDLVLYETESQTLAIEKIPSSLNNQAEGVLAGMARMGIKANRLERMVHGTTVATNTVLELTGARVAVVTTAGHKDVLVVGRGNRTALYNIKAPPSKPLIPRSLCFEVDERLRADGTVIRNLDEKQVAAIADHLAAENVDAVAVCFLHSYINPEHELRCAQILQRKLPNCVIVTSAEVLPEYREYERFSTTVLNAYIAPAMRRYLHKLQTQLHKDGLQTKLEIMTSNGGSLPASRIHAIPVLTMLSGPAAGVIAAVHVGKITNHPNLITCDIGGTSSDVCLIHDSEFAMTTDGHVGALPVKVRQIDIHTIAVGGGSIASSTDSGFLTVGPRSAGSKPGPACYGRGGILPTITDANVVLGLLSADRPLGKEIHLDPQAARDAVGRLAQKVGLGVEEMAQGIIRIATISLASAIKEVSIMSGQDPRQFALLPCGGAGPLQAVDVAAELGMNTVLVPPLPGNFSALGLLVSDARRDYVKTRISSTQSTEIDTVRNLLNELALQGHEEFDAAGFDKAGRIFSATLDMRYSGQSFELPVAVNFDVTSIEKIEQAFEDMYVSRYGAKSQSSMEIVSYRVVAWSISAKPKLPGINPEERSLAAALSGHRPVYVNAAAIRTPIYNRDLLPPESTLEGPLLVEEEGSTTVVPEGWTVELDLVGCLILRQRQGRK
ncbi:MAG: hydantoinase/oxoprolinase family protein [Candidimonas sp.]|nr:MAG: hydantoinase/oxoprolinase family protein [Candidimonas sp.]